MSLNIYEEKKKKKRRESKNKNPHPDENHKLDVLIGFRANICGLQIPTINFTWKWRIFHFNYCAKPQS